MPQTTPQPPQKKLLTRSGPRLSRRLKHFSLSTERSDVAWIHRYILFHNKRHPQDMGAGEVREFLSHLAVTGRVAASTQNQCERDLVFVPPCASAPEWASSATLSARSA